jgi:hypothetical protein
VPSRQLCDGCERPGPHVGRWGRVGDHVRAGGGLPADAGGSSLTATPSPGPADESRGRRQHPRLADGGAEQVPDAVGEGQSERSADDYPQDGAADVAAAQAGAEGTGQTESDQDGGKGDRYP